MADTTQTANVNDTIALLQSGLVSIDPEAAVANIESWQEQLKGTPFAETLGELKLAIDGGIRSGEIGSILSDLAKQLNNAAQSQEGEVATQLQQLAQVLSSAMQ
jgi:type II secretory pathway component PulF